MCILTFKFSSHKEYDKAVKLLNMTLFKNSDDSNRADTVFKISNITSNQCDFEVRSVPQSPAEDHYIHPIKAENVINVLEPSTVKLKLSVNMECIIKGQARTQGGFGRFGRTALLKKVHNLHFKGPPY